MKSMDGATASGQQAIVAAGRLGACQLGNWAIVPRQCVFGLNLEHCPNCGVELKNIAAILEQPLIERFPTHLELQPARARPAAQLRREEPDPVPESHAEHAPDVAPPTDAVDRVQ